MDHVPDALPFLSYAPIISPRTPNAPAPTPNPNYRIP